jgi:hypothetical protein
MALRSIERSLRELGSAFLSRSISLLAWARVRG